MLGAEADTEDSDMTPKMGTGSMHICLRIGRLAALSLRSPGQCVGS